MSARKGKKKLTREDRRVVKEELRMTRQVFAKHIKNLKELMLIEEPVPVTFCLN